MIRLGTIFSMFLMQLCLLPGLICAQQQWLPKAHAHNDYYHKRPLLDALDQGFSSVEADVFLRKGELVVAHSFLEIRPERTLRKLYLQPLFARLEEGKNTGGLADNFLLLIDFKNEGSATLEILQKQLAPYKRHLTRLEAGKLVQGAVTVVISGNRPGREIAAAKDRWVFLDGRLNDPAAWGKEISPLVSESWNAHFKYRGFGEMKPEEASKLKAMVQQVHAQGKRLRFWALPDREKRWQVAYDAGRRSDQHGQAS